MIQLHQSPPYHHSHSSGPIHNNRVNQMLTLYGSHIYILQKKISSKLSNKLSDKLCPLETVNKLWFFFWNNRHVTNTHTQWSELRISSSKMCSHMIIIGFVGTGLPTSIIGLLATDISIRAPELIRNTNDRVNSRGSRYNGIIPL